MLLAPADCLMEPADCLMERSTVRLIRTTNWWKKWWKEITRRLLDLFELVCNLQFAIAKHWRNYEQYTRSLSQEIRC